MLACALLVLLVLCSVPAAAQPKTIDASTMAKANNPLADMNALNFQNYYSPSLIGVPDATSNTMNLRGVMVVGRHLVRATLPVSSSPFGADGQVAGLGDFNIFDAIVVTGKDASTTIGVGPLLVAPTATEDPLGAHDAWQAGAAVVAVHGLEHGSLIGGLLTWQTDVAGGDDRADTNLLAAQYFVTMALSGGWYLRSSPISVFDFENDAYLVPMGLGVGKVFGFAGAVVNAFVEPQVSVYHDGDGLPSYQVFTGFNLQFPQGK